MGIIADTFKAKIDELKRLDEESQRETMALLARLNALANTLESLEFDDE